VRVASAGDDALRAVAEFGPELVLLDVMMPRMTVTTSAEDSANPLARREDHHALRQGRDVEVTKGMAVGADAYVTRPFSTKDLVAARAADARRIAVPRRTDSACPT